MEDAIKRTRQLGKDVTSLLATMCDRKCQCNAITLNYVDETIAVSGGQKDLLDFTAQIIWFERACIAALDQMEEMSPHHFWPDGFAWQMWIKNLTKVAENHQLPTPARKDTDKQRNVSPFVVFVCKLQTYIPATHRRATQSIGALSVAINTARRQPKSSA
jgi:hypothetical protein